MKLKSYLAEMARLSDNEWTGGLEETANWHRKTDGSYASCLISLNSLRVRRFNAEKTGDPRSPWRATDTLTGKACICRSLEECRTWAQKKSEEYSRYRKEAYCAGVTAYTVEGKRVRINAISAGDPVSSCLYKFSDDPEGPSAVCPDVTWLYISRSDAEKGFAEWVREAVMDVLNEEEKKMKTVCIRAYPYATQEAEFLIPAGLSPEEEHAFIEAHFDEIRFGAPDLDYKGTDFEYFDAD